MTRTALYARVSSDKQAREGDSIPAQLDALRKFALSNNLTVVGEFIDDGISGTKYANRDELQRLLAEVEADRIDLILVTKMDRLHRSLRNFLNMQDVLDRHKCNWMAISEPNYDTTTPQGRMIINLMMNLAEFEAGQTSVRIKQVQAYKTSQREVISGTMTPGYKIEDKHMVIDEATAPAVRLAFQTFAETGSYAQTIRATYGTGLPISGNGMKNMLRREVYTGRRHGLDDFAPRIIDDDLFGAVQKQMTMCVRSSTKRTNLFGGLLVCAECGRKMASLNRQKKETHKRYMMYRCSKHYQRTVKQCPNGKVVYENVLERYLLDQLPKAIIQRVEIAEEQSRIQVDVEKQRKALEHKIDRLKELYINDLIDLEEYRTDKERLLAELDTLEPAQNAPVTRSDALEGLVGMDIEQVYGQLTRDEKKQFWRMIVKKIRFDMERNFFVDFM